MPRSTRGALTIALLLGVATLFCGCPPKYPKCGKDEDCKQGEFCALGAACAYDQGACTSSEQCGFDSYCEGGQCIPFGTPAGHDHDDSCTLKIDIDAILPAVQCRWTGPPNGDAFPDYFHVMATPVVVDFNLDRVQKFNSAGTFVTGYGYDALDRVTSVTPSGSTQLTARMPLGAAPSTRWYRPNSFRLWLPKMK